MNGPKILLNMGPVDRQNTIVSVSPEFQDHLESKCLSEQILLNAPDLNQNDRYVLEQYMLWVSFQPGFFMIPNLDSFRDYLLNKGLKPGTVSHYISTVRKRYEQLSCDRDLLFHMVRQDLNWFEQKAVVDELVERIRNAIHGRVGRVRCESIQDEPDDKHRRLTRDQVDQLIHLPGTDTLRALRNTAMIALALCTGVRESELVNLQVSDLRQHLDGEVALYVRKGKGNKKRLIPYGALDWCLPLVDAWLEAAGIRSGALFRRVVWYASEKQHKVLPQSSHLAPSSVNDILDSYMIEIRGEYVKICPHDLRRTYALRCFEAGMELVRIQRNLGHVNNSTTLQYIGSLEGGMRRPPAAYHVPNDLLLKLNQGKNK